MKKILFVSIAFVLVLAGCGGTPKPVTEVTVVATDFAYEPNMIYVPLGEEVTITFRNDGQVEHDFVVTEISLAGADEHMEESGEHMDEGEGEHMDETTDEHMDEDMGVDEHADAEHAAYAIHALTQPGDSATIKFTALEAGEYEIFCTVQGHKDAGMIGTLVVVAPE
ncbi:MAG TPA: cupredoxin domain-containing protein [Anaerolineales bacterium]|nr:cupredoxin domain-containing protein [Anaerolineales bacterium]